MTHAITIDSPVGRLTVAEADGAIVRIGWGDGGDGEGTPLLAEAADQLGAYFAGRLMQFDLPLVPAGSAFDQRVWAAMQQIPYGQTRRYGELAMEVGSAPRAQSAAPAGATRSRSSFPVTGCWRAAGSAATQAAPGSLPNAPCSRSNARYPCRGLKLESGN